MKQFLEATITHKDKFHRDGTPNLSGITGEQLRDYYIVVPDEDKPYKIVHKGKTFRGRRGIGDYIKRGDSFERVYFNNDVYDQLGEVVMVLTDDGWEHKYEPKIIGAGTYGRWKYAPSDKLNPELS